MEELEGLEKSRNHCSSSWGVSSLKTAASGMSFHSSVYLQYWVAHVLGPTLKRLQSE
jgi:hypothetical protein